MGDRARHRGVVLVRELSCERFLRVSQAMATSARLPFVPPPSSAFLGGAASRVRVLAVNRRPLGTSFFNGGVGALKFTSLRTSKANRLRCGALGAQSNLFSRLVRIFKSYAGAILSAFEDPEKIFNQAILEMNDDLAKMRQATAQVLASQKRLENNYKAAQKVSDDWYRRAKLALSKGDENLALDALKRRKAYSDNASSLKAQLDQQKGMVDNLVSKTRLLESKIQEAQSKKDNLKARAQSAKTTTTVNEILGNVNTSSALSAFGRMEEKVLAMESQAEALSQLTADDLEEKFTLLDGSSVDDDLLNLKRELSGNSYLKIHPAGRITVSSSSNLFPLVDMEVEKELNELRMSVKEH